MAQQFTTAPTSSNPYVSKRLNNMEEVSLFKKECNNWTRIYYKLLQDIETMIDIQKQVQDIITLAEETNTTIMEMKGTILKASNNHWILNTANIFSISENLQSLVQNNIENRAYQVQRLLADELDKYKERGNMYVDEHIKKIQELYKEKGGKQ